MELIDLNKIDIPKTQIKTTYHDPCHIARKYQIYNPPREILNQISSFKDMKLNKENSLCCGAGAGCLSAFPELSEKIAASRIQDANDLNCEYLVTTCPFCEYNLDKGNNSNLKVISIQKLLDKLKP